MSVYYDVREHLVISDVEEAYDYVDLLRGHMAMIGALMLCDEVRYCSMKLVTDQKTCQFDGVRVNDDLHSMVASLEDATSIEWNVSWGYRSTVGGGIAALASPDTMCNMVEEMDQEDAVPEAVFYSCYQEADCGDGVGSALAYGVWNGKRYHGSLEYHSIEQLPEDGLWRTPQTAVIWDVDWPEKADRKRITEIAEQLSTLSEMDNISIDEETISLFINNVMLHGRKDIEKYLSLCAELNELTNGECFIADELEDAGSLNPRLLRFDFDEAGQWKYQMAAV